MYYLNFMSDSLNTTIRAGVLHSFLMSKASARIVRWFVLFVRKYIIFISCQLSTY